jgi:hypothetical protein
MTVSYLSDAREQKALEWATDFFRENADDLTPEGCLDEAYDPDSLIEEYDEWRKRFPNRQSWPDPAVYLKERYGFEPQMIRLLRVSLTTEGDPAISNLCALAAELIERGEPLSETLKIFIIKYLRRDPSFEPAKKRGPKYHRRAYRDVCIVEAIEHITETWKFHATRNPATEGPSAASIVVVALKNGADIKLTEAAINKIWREFGGRRNKRSR